LNWEDWEDHTYFRNAIVTQNQVSCGVFTFTEQIFSTNFPQICLQKKLKIPQLQYDQISMSKRAKRELRLTIIDDAHDLEDEDWFTNTEGNDTNIDDVVPRVPVGAQVTQVETFVFFVVKGTGAKDRGHGKQVGYLNVRDAPGANLIGRIDEGTRVRSYLNKSMVCVKGLYWQEIAILAGDQAVVVRSDRSGQLDAMVNTGIRRVMGHEVEDNTLQHNIEETCSLLNVDTTDSSSPPPLFLLLFLLLLFLFRP